MHRIDYMMHIDMLDQITNVTEVYEAVSWIFLERVGRVVEGRNGRGRNQ